MVFISESLLLLIGILGFYFLIKKFRKKCYYLLIILFGFSLYGIFPLFRGLNNDTTINENHIEVDIIRIKESGSSIIINSPENESWSNSPPTLNINCNDTDCHTLWYGNGIINITLVNNTDQSLDEDIWNALPEGKYVIFIYANDTSGHLIDKCMLILHKDTQAPRIVINSPNNQTYWNSSPSINITVFDPKFKTLYYKIKEFGDTMFFLTNNTARIIPNSRWSDLLEGQFMIEIFADDYLDQVNDTYKLILFKDTIAPTITINYPNLNCIYGINAPRFNISISLDTLDKIWYNLDGYQENYLVDEFFGVINQKAWNNFGNGTVTIRFYVNDTAGNIGVDNIIIRKDALIPNIIINSPVEYQEFGSNAPQFNLTIIEDKLNTCWYTLDGGLTNISFFNNIGQIDQGTWEEIWKSHENGGLITIRFYANDSAGNLGYQDVIIKIKKPIPYQLPNPILSITAGAIVCVLGISTFSLKKSKKYKRMNPNKKNKLNIILSLSILLTGLLLLISFI
ncbi:MAG: hypothetical protein ACFFHD_08065 [Promethearchaeota archaeon]